MEKMNGSILIYQNESGNTKVDAYFNDSTIWMSQKSIAELYQVNVRTINEHINNILQEGELDEATIRNFRIVEQEGERNVTREVMHYNLQMVLAVGYRVRNNIGMHFRNGASTILSEYMQKGFAMNDERLKNPKEFGADYFDELLERIRDIRASEKRVYKTVQNKLHYSVHGHTAAELIAERADASKDNMGLTSFNGVKVRKADVTIAKNYLNKEEIENLNRIVTMYLDYAEDQAKQHIPMHMKDWEEKLIAFLRFTGREILENAGTISKEFADLRAKEQYIRYEEHRRKNERQEVIDELPNVPKKKK